MSFVNKIRVPGHTFKLGRQRSDNPVQAAHPLHFDRMKAELGIAVPAGPVTFDYLSTFPLYSGVLLNDILGNCAFAALYHRMQVVAWHLTGRLIDPEVLTPLAYEFYKAAGGFNPYAPLDANGVNPTDAGGDPIAIAKFLRTQGLPSVATTDTNKFAFSFQVDPSKAADMAFVGQHCYGVGLGVIVTDQVMPSTGQIPQVWPAGGNPEGGHEIYAAGRAADGTWRAVSWGQQFGLSPEFMKPFNGQNMTDGNIEAVTAYIDSDMFLNGATVMGLTLAQLDAYVDQHASEITDATPGMV